MNNFGVIEVASGKARNAPGWAYVPDTGINPAVTALQPSNRKRARNTGPNVTLSDLSARQEAKLRKELETLDRDSSHKDAHIAIPAKSGSGRGNKHTPGVRKILMSQKTFANHLDDFDALHALHEANPPPSPAPAPPAAAPTPPPPPSARAARAAAQAKKQQKRTTSAAPPSSATAPDPASDTPMPDATADPDPSTILASYPPPPPHPADADPLLAARLPPVPSDAELRALLAAPALTYAGARVGWSGRYPVREFCGVCGYWGRVKCLRCGARVCALECLEVHREECVTRYGL